MEHLCLLDTNRTAPRSRLCSAALSIAPRRSKNKSCQPPGAVPLLGRQTSHCSSRKKAALLLTLFLSMTLLRPWW